MNILIIAAHPDDEVLGVGGTIVKYKKKGYKVYVHIVTDGSSLQYKDEPEKALKKENEINKALNLLGVDRVFRGKLPDMKLDTISHTEINMEIGRVIEEVKPEIVYTHHKGDVNKDHRLIFESTLVMSRPLMGNSIVELYSYEVLSSTEWGDSCATDIFIPNVYIELSEEDIELKCKAMKEYTTELREYPHPRSVDAIINQSKMRGNQVEAKYAEAFRLIRRVERIK